MTWLLVVMISGNFIASAHLPPQATAKDCGTLALKAQKIYPAARITCVRHYGRMT